MRYLFGMILVLLVATMAAAQSPMAIDFEAAFTPDYAPRDLPAFRRDLALDEEQTAIVESLLHDHAEKFDAAMMLVREDLRAAQAALGAEDPEVDRQREALREELATVFEAMQQDLQNLPEGSTVAEVREKYEHPVQEIKDRLESLQPHPMKAEELAQMFDAASARLEQWRNERVLLAAALAENVKTVLREDQRERWPMLDRRIRRQNELGRGRLQGENVDILLLVRDQRLDVESTEVIKPIMTDYEMQLDAALRARVEKSGTAQRAMFKAVQAGDREGLNSIIREITATRVAVRDVNDNTVATLAAALGEREGPGMIEGYRQRAYPQVFRETQTLRLMKAARELGGLTTEQSESLDDLQAAYEAELAPQNERVLAAVRQFEPEQLTLREVLLLLPPTPEMENEERDRGPDGVQKAFTQRVEMGQKYDAQLQAILGEELYERLPRNTGRVRPPQPAPADTSDADI